MDLAAVAAVEEASIVVAEAVASVAAEEAASEAEEVEDVDLAAVVVEVSDQNCAFNIDFAL